MGNLPALAGWEGLPFTGKSTQQSTQGAEGGFGDRGWKATPTENHSRRGRGNLLPLCSNWLWERPPVVGAAFSRD